MIIKTKLIEKEKKKEKRKMNMNKKEFKLQRIFKFSIKKKIKERGKEVKTLKNQRKNELNRYR